MAIFSLSTESSPAPCTILNPAPDCAERLLRLLGIRYTTLALDVPDSLAAQGISAIEKKDPAFIRGLGDHEKCSNWKTKSRVQGS